MNSTVIFGISCRALLPPSREVGGFALETEASFRRLMELTGCGPRGNPASITAEVSLDHPGLPEALRLIRNETGRLPAPRLSMQPPDALKYFSAWVVREYDEGDVGHLPYVRVHCIRQIADSREPVQTDDERYLATANRRLAGRLDFGTLGKLPAYAMDTRIKNVLEQQSLKGFKPRLVPFDKPEQAAKELWQPWSDVVMPQCLLPLVDNLGQPTTPDKLADPIELKDRPRDPGRGVHYTDGPYRESELCYSTAEVAGLGDFDIAIARERVGAARRVAFRPLIISQRFRHLLVREKLAGIRFTPVRMLNKGDRLWDNPFESMVGPYEEKPPVADR